MLSSSDIKREIIQNSDTSPFKKKMESVPAGMTEDDQIEIGNALEATTKTGGWAIMEQFMLTRMNVMGMIMDDKSSDISRGIAKGYIEFMQWIDLSVKRKNEIIERERLKYEQNSKSVSKDEKE